MRTLRCPECGRGEIRPIAAAGRRMRFRHIPDLELPSDVEIPTCDSCGNQWLDAKTTEAVDAALRLAYQAALVSKAAKAIDALTEHYTQQYLERLFGLSAGYLSKVKSGKETSAQLTGLLQLLAREPSRVDELVEVWRMEPSAGQWSKGSVSLQVGPAEVMPLVEAVPEASPPAVEAHVAETQLLRMAR